ncbi:MAG: DUF4388 domain-containing protein [Blastocatellia bacterium]
MTDGKDRREAKRISYICEVECEGIGINRLATRITDLSTTGAFIDSMTCFTQGTILKIRFRVKEMFIDTDCEVRYSMPQMGMGVRFLSLKPEHIAVLEHFVEGKPLVLPEEPVVEAQEPEPVASKNDSGLLGNFAIVSLFDIIQIIENNKLTGSLAVRSPAAGGEIHFNEGVIVGAKSGPNIGQEALVGFLDVTEGTFVFNGSEIEYERTIRASSNMGLMLDLLRVKDEEAAFQ